MGFASLNIHVEIHKIYIKNMVIPIKKFNLFLNLFSNTKFSKRNAHN
jgi:NADPH-dependent 7-cyano-7-deazaguanine reductase QueF-like protein